MILKVDIIFFFFGFVEDYSFFCNVFEYELSIFHVYSCYAFTLKVVISRKKKNQQIIPFLSRHFRVCTSF